MPDCLRAVFLDRDGVINRYPGHHKYVTSVKEFRLLPGVGKALRRLNQAGLPLFIVSNQAGVSKGIYPQETLDEITRRMLRRLGKGIAFRGIYYCTHLAEERCSCRKPATGLVEKGLALLEGCGSRVDRERSFFVGDSIADVQTGRQAGLKTILVFSGREKPENKPGWGAIPDFTAADLPDAAEIILKIA